MKKRRMLIMAKNEVVKDSGSMQEFSSGAHRDATSALTKGDMSLVPLEYVSMMMDNDPVLSNIAIFMDRRDAAHLIDALRCSINTVPVFRYDEILAEMAEQGIEMRVYENEKEKANAVFSHMILEASKIFAAGGEKYGRFAFVHQ
jgi:hypothetical protein